MPYTFNLGAVPTGSLALVFRVKGEALPERVQLSLVAGEEEPVITEPLPFIEAGDWYFCAPPPPIPWETEHTVQVLFDDQVVHTFADPVMLPRPGRRKAAVIRQRIYEVLYNGWVIDEIEAQPYGSPHAPAAVGEGPAFKTAVIEVGAGYISDATLPAADTHQSQVTIPLTGYLAIDDTTDTQELASLVEEAAGYLLEADWKLAGFGVHQSASNFTMRAPDMTSDRRMAKIEAELTIPYQRALH